MRRKIRMDTTVINSTALVQVMDNQVVVSSRQIAEYFERNHRDVVRAITNLRENMEGSGYANFYAHQMFTESTYTDEQGRTHAEYLMNRDGFSLLVMGFNNTEKVLQWKLKFIEAFNKMEEHIKQQHINQTQAYPVQPGRTQAIIAAGQTANALQLFFGVSEGIARVHALTIAEEDYEVDLNEVKQLLPPTNEPVDILNPTEIGAKLTELTGTKYRANQVNLLLQEMGFQNNNNKTWELTESGKQYGSMFPYERNGHTGFQLRWKSEIVKVIQAYLQK